MGASPSTPLSTALSSMQRGEYKLAVSSLSRSVSANRNDYRLYYNRGLALLELEEYEKAVEDFAHALSLRPSHAPSRLSRGIALAYLHRYEEAELDLQHVAEAEEGTEIDEGEAREQASLAYVNLGVVYFHRRLYERAASYFTSAISMKNTESSTFGFRGVTELCMGKTKEALSDLTRCITMRPDDAYGLLHRAVAYMHEGDYATALEDLRSCLTLKPSDPTAHNNCGVAYFELGKWKESERSFMRALQLQPNYFTALYNKTLLLRRQGKVKLALETANKLVSARPEAVDGYNCRSLCYIDLQDMERAVEELERGFELDPTAPSLHNTYAYIYLVEGRYESAQKEAEKTLLAEPRSVSALNTLGISLLAQGGLREAEEEFSNALSVAPHHRTSLLNRGLARKRLRKWDEAEQDLRRVIENQSVVDADEEWREERERETVKALVVLGDVLRGKREYEESMCIYDAAVQTLEGRNRDEREESLLQAAYVGKGLAIANYYYGSSNGSDLQESAESWFYKVLSSDPTNVRARICLAMALRLKGAKDEAVSEAEKAVAAKKESAFAHNELGLCYAVVGRVRDAIEQFTAASRLEEDYSIGRSNSDRIQGIVKAMEEREELGDQLEDEVEMDPSEGEDVNFEDIEMHLDISPTEEIQSTFLLKT